MILHSNILGNGQPLLILHGFLGMGDNWKTLGQDFSEQGYQVHLIDQRNHGRSFHDEEFNYDVLAKDLEHYCDNFNIKNMILLGHSMGGKTAMLFAVRYPELVSKLIVADISPRFYPIHHDTILAGLSEIDSTELKSRTEADTILKNYVSEFGTRQFLLKNLYRKTREKLDLRINLEVLKENVSEVGEALPNHAQFHGSTLFLRGDKSEYIGTQDEDIIKSHFPNSEIKTVNNAGHWLHAENPKEFYQNVMNFLKA